MGYCDVVDLPRSDQWNIYHARGEEKYQGPALFNRVPCSGVTAPGVDNNGVILLSVAAFLHPHRSFFFCSSVSFLTELARRCMFSHLSFEHSLAQFRLRWRKWELMESLPENTRIVLISVTERPPHSRKTVNHYIDWNVSTRETVFLDLTVRLDLEGKNGQLDFGRVSMLLITCIF